MSEDAGRLQRVGRLNRTVVGGGDDGWDVYREANRLAHADVVERLLLDIRSDPDIIDRRQLLGLQAGRALDVLGDAGIDAREVDLASLQRELRGLVVGDRLADDLCEG